MECSKKHLYNAYLLHVLQKRSIELNAAYKHIVQLDSHKHVVRSDAFVQTSLETDDTLVQNGPDADTGCSQCCVLKKTVQKIKQQSTDSIYSASADRDAEIAELKKQLSDSARLILELKERAEAEETARKVKEEQVEELEELVMVCKSESVASVQEQNRSRENESLKSELDALKLGLQAKEEAQAQYMFEKDDMQDNITSLQAAKASLKLQLKKQSADFQKQIQHLANEKRELLEKLEYLNTEVKSGPQSASVQFGCSQAFDPLASQQSTELTSVKMELLAVQAEKDDLMQQLGQYKADHCSVQSGFAQSHQESRKNSAIAAVCTESYNAADGLESQNAALLGQLLVMEDQLSESEMMLHESRESHQQTAEQLTTAQQQLREYTTRCASLEQKKRELEAEIQMAKSNLENSEAGLQECKAELLLVEGKLSVAGKRQRQLLCQKQQLETQNRELSRKLQLATESSAHTVNVRNLELGRSLTDVSKNRATFGGTVAVTTAGTFKQKIRNFAVDDDFKLAAQAPKQVFFSPASSLALDRPMVPYTTSPVTLSHVAETPTSVRSVISSGSGDRSSTNPLKRRTADTATVSGSGGKRHLFTDKMNHLTELDQSDDERWLTGTDTELCNNNDSSSLSVADAGVISPLQPVDNMTACRRTGGRSSLSLSRRLPKNLSDTA